MRDKFFCDIRTLFFGLLAELLPSAEGFALESIILQVFMATVKLQYMASVVDSSLDAAAQDFSWVVRSARQLYLEGNQTCNGAKIQLSEPVYGRICSSRKAEPPIKLTTNLSRKTAFIFGSDAIASIVLQNNAYDTLRRLGFTPDYLHYDVCK